MPDSMPIVVVDTGDRKPSRADEINAIGAQYHIKNQMDAARIHYLAALSIEPRHAFALRNLSAALIRTEKYEAGATIARMSVHEAPDSPYAKGNLAVALLGTRKYSQSVEVFKEVVKELPNDAMMWHNYGLALYMSNRFSEALPAFEHSVKIDPTLINTLNDLSLCRLALGNIQDGLREYEVRWKTLYNSPVWKLGIEQWQGEPLADKHLLIHHEQGFGDGIMLCRWIKQLSQMAEKVTVAVPESLRKLMEFNFPDLTVVNWEDKEELARVSADFHIPMLSIPRWLGINFPSDIKTEPYLKAPKIDFTIPEADLKIGLCWASGDHGEALKRRRRVVPLNLFLPLIEIPEVKLFSLQKGGAEKEIIELGLESIIYDQMARCESFAETAAIIDRLDIVISVDSVVAHIAGALGKPCLMLGPYTRCWRWWSEKSGKPWYDKMEIFTQQSDGRWEIPVGNLIMAVKRQIRRNSHGKSYQFG